MIDYMYHPGDRVRVKPELFEYEDYKMLSGKNKGQCWLVLSWMKKYAGQEIVIQEIVQDRGVYKAQGIDGCIWTDEMFEPLVVDECLALWFILPASAMAAITSTKIMGAIGGRTRCLQRPTNVSVRRCCEVNYGREIPVRNWRPRKSSRRY